MNCWRQKGHALFLGAPVLLPLIDVSAVDPGVPICSAMVGILGLCAMRCALQSVYGRIEGAREDGVVVVILGIKNRGEGMDGFEKDRPRGSRRIISCLYF